MNLHIIALHPRTLAINPSGHGTPGVRLGKQPDGSYLVLLDLDSHTTTQNADATLATMRAGVPARITDRLAIQRSRSGRGYHIPLRLPFDPGSCKLYLDGVHVGELITSGHTYLDPDWIQGSAATIPLLCHADWETLCRAFDMSALRTSATSYRKQRAAEGEKLIAGWEQIADWHEYRALLLDPQRNKNAAMLNQRLLALRRTPTDRSAAYGRLLQALMLSAYALPVLNERKYTIVAAIAIRTGAAGKEQDKDYRIARDTAALIAKIAHGDTLERGGQWIQPGWCKDTHTAPSSQSSQPAAPRASPGRPAGSRQQQIVKTLRYLVRHADGEEWRGTVAELAAALKVAHRTMQTYLHDLQAAGCIQRGQLGGNGPLIIFITKSSFGGADNSAKADTTSAKTAAVRGADATPEYRTDVRQTGETTAQCNKEEETPKIAASRPAAAARPQGVGILGVSQSVAAAALPPAPGSQGHSIDAVLHHDSGRVVWRVWDDALDRVVAEFATEAEALARARSLEAEPEPTPSTPPVPEPSANGEPAVPSLPTLAAAVAACLDELPSERPDPQTGELRRWPITARRVLAALRERWPDAPWSEAAIRWHYDRERERRTYAIFDELRALTPRQLHRRIDAASRDVARFDAILETRQYKGHPLDDATLRYWRRLQRASAGFVQLASRIYADKTAHAPAPEPETEPVAPAVQTSLFSDSTAPPGLSPGAIAVAA